MVATMIAPALRRLTLAVLLACACSSGPGAGAVEVQVAGAARTLSRAQLEALPAATVEYKEHRYTGVRLRDVLGEVGAAADAPLQASAADGYAKQLAPETLGRDDALLAYAVDGGPLPAGEGPLRLVVPGSPGLSIKQLVRLGPP